LLVAIAAAASHRYTCNLSQTYFQFRNTLYSGDPTHLLDVVDTARLFAIGFTASSDDIIGCVDVKYHYLFWRPASRDLARGHRACRWRRA